MARLGEAGGDPLYTRQTIPAPGIRVSNRTVAPAASAVLADTGALAAGDYRLEIQMAFADTLAAGKCLVLEHRDAANAATLRNPGACPAGTAVTIVIERFTVAANERVRVVNDLVAGAVGSVAVTAIRAALLP